MSGQPNVPPPSYGDATQGNKQYGGHYGGGEYNTGYAAGQYGVNQPGYQGANQYGQPGHLGGYPDEEAVFNTASFDDKAIRHQFIRKVYLILMVQLLFTFSIVALFLFVESIRNWIHGPGSWFYFVSYATFLVTYIALACCPSVRRKSPGNYIALGVFTMAFTYMCATIASYHDAQAVLIAAGITAAVTLGVSLFACQTKIDFTMCTGLIFAASLVLLLVGLMYIIVLIALPPGDTQSRYYVQCAYAGIASLILCLFLVFDTQMIVGGKRRRYQLSPEEHILGAMELYLDIVYLFLMILSLFGSKD